MVFGMFSRASNAQTAANDNSCQVQASDNVSVTSITKRPRAIVVIFGHMGATAEQLASYAQLYHDYKCSTICATAPILSLASHDVTALGEVAITACRETARLIRTAEMSEMGFGRVPVVVHVLGNGGAQVLEEMEKRIQEVIPKAEMKKRIERTARPVCGTAPPYNSSSRRGGMTSMKSSSSRSLMKASSTRSLMKPPLVKSTSAPPKTSKGSTRSVVTATSLSDEDENLGIEIPCSTPPERSTIYSEKFKEKLDRLRSKSPLMEIKRGWQTYSRPKGLTGAPACVSSQNLLIPQCVSAFTNTQLLERGTSTMTTSRNRLPEYIHATAAAAYNPLRRRLERRRCRKQSSPHVKRIDMERSGLVFASAAPRYNPEDRAYKMDMELFSSRLVLGSVVFDSGPYYPSVEKETAAVEELLGPQHGSSNPAIKFLALSAIVAAHGWRGLTHFNYLGYLPTTDNDGLAEIGRPAQFWKNMTNLHLSKRHAYIYSQADQICQRDAVRNLIKGHKLNGIETIEIELVASRHLQHRKRRCDKYSEFVESVVNSLEGRSMDVQESVAEWFDSDEEDAIESDHEIVQREERDATVDKYSIVETGSRVQ
jgi:hypothetical protein